MLDSTRSSASRQLEWTAPSWASPVSVGHSTLDNFNQNLPGSRFDMERPQTAPPAHQYPLYQGGAHAMPSTATLTQPAAYPGMPMMAAMQTAPGMPPVVGYIIPYEQDIFHQLQGDRVSDGGSSQGSRKTRRARELALSEAAAAMESEPGYSSEYDDDAPSYSPQPRPTRRRPVTAPPRGTRQGAIPSWNQGYGYESHAIPDGGFEPMPSDGAPPYSHNAYAQYPHYPPTAPPAYPQRAFRPSQDYSHADLMIDEAIVAGLESSGGRKGRKSSKWRTSQDLPPGQLSVLADGSPYRRSTPYGLLQELQSFIGSRRDSFLNHWMMASADAGNRGRPVGYLGSEPQVQKVGHHIILEPSHP
jgi:hypothetical protein